jgi:hypothetical protein
MSKQFDPQSMVTVEEREGYDREYVAVAPKDLYSKTVAHIKAVLKEGKAPARYIDVGGEIRQNPLVELYGRAVRVPEQSWDHALEPGDNYPPKARTNRAEALEVARLWFKEVLHQQIDYKPLGLHITKDERYRL